MFEAPATAPMEFGDYLQILRRRAWVVVVVTVLAVGISYAWYSTKDKTYTASGEVVVRQGTGEVDVVTQAKIMESAVVYQLAQKQVATAVGVSAQQSGDSGSIQITADSSDPQVAAASVNAAMTAYVDYLKQKAQDGYTACRGAAPAPDRQTARSRSAASTARSRRATGRRSRATSGRCWPASSIRSRSA